jgi:hypothetical protein
MLTKRITISMDGNTTITLGQPLFFPNGTIPIVCINVPDIVHNSLIADWGSVYEKLEDVWERCGGKCTVDSAFSARWNEYLIRSSQTAVDGNTRAEFAFNLPLNK